MRTPRPGLTARSLIAIALVGMLALGGGIYVGVNFAVERAVTEDAKLKARSWADYFLTAMPELDRLLTDGRLDPAQSEVVQTARQLGDVFRFKLYSPAAKQMLVSDEADDAGAATRSADDDEPETAPQTAAADNDEEDEAREAPEHNLNAADVLASGTASIEVHQGDGSADAPPLYVEAYVPIAEKDGRTHGVVEVYINQTGTADIFRSTFAVLAIGLAIVAALAFGLPTLAFLFRSRQASEANRKAEFLARHDAMTGLLNRAGLADRLTQLIRRARVERSRLAVVFLDVDDFKAINDSFGEESGDEFLNHVARSLQALAGRNDIVARPGGDEFTLTMGGRSAEEVVAQVEAVMQAVREPVSIRGRAVSGRLSAGIYFVSAGDSLADALHKADVALYQAKVDGRNTVRVFTEEMETRMSARRALEQRVREATAANGFELYFQPLLDARSRRCAGFEALLRLPDGSGGHIQPTQFIPLAESLGLINDIGAWVLHEATRVAASWPRDLFVAVNLSVKQFADGKLVGEVETALRESRLDARQLELEVTESMLIENAEGVGAQLATLRALGVSIAMDDFGTGYSSLGYLWQFGFDKLKIDRSFVSGLDRNDQRAREILDTIIVLGHKLDMTVTAEGIETEEHAEVLSELACDHFQGYLYGRPSPASDLAAFLLDNLRDHAATPAAAAVPAKALA